MADLPGTPDFPEIPVPQVQAPNQASVPPSSGAAGLGGNKLQVASDVLAAINGLRTGYVNSQIKKFDNLQTSAAVAKSTYDGQNVLLDSYAKAVAAGQMDRNDPRIKQAMDARDQAKAVMNQRLEQLQGLFGKPAKAKPGQEGQETAHSKLGKALNQIFHTTKDVAGKVLFPNPFSTPGTPQFNPASQPVPAAPSSLPYQDQ